MPMLFSFLELCSSMKQKKCLFDDFMNMSLLHSKFDRSQFFVAWLNRNIGFVLHFKK